MDPVPASARKDPEADNSAPGENSRLDSWKEIAAYLRRSVRTVVRWEQEEGLHVRRQSHRKRGTVYAFPDELDAWVKSRSPEAAPEASEQPVEPGGQPVTAELPRSAWRHRIALVAALLVILAGAAWILIPRRVYPREVALAVLPFVNEDAEPALEPLSDGIAEDLTRRLSRAAGPDFRVLAHAMVRGTHLPPSGLPSAMQRLGANTVLLGRFSERGGRLVVTAELLAVADATQIWSARYERQPGELQAIIGELSREVASTLVRRLQPELSQALARPDTASKEAYREYLIGRFHWNKRTGAGITAAILHFQNAVAADPGYARAYAGLADAYALFSYYAPAAPAEGAPKARAAALRALELDGRLADAYAALAEVESDYYRDWRGAESHFLRALELNPDYAAGATGTRNSFPSSGATTKPSNNTLAPQNSTRNPLSSPPTSPTPTTLRGTTTARSPSAAKPSRSTRILPTPMPTSAGRSCSRGCPQRPSASWRLRCASEPAPSTARAAWPTRTPPQDAPPRRAASSKS